MTHEETAILNFLEEAPDAWYSRREVARKAVNRRIYEEDRNWASPAFSGMIERGLIEESATGSIKFKKRAW